MWYIHKSCGIYTSHVVYIQFMWYIHKSCGIYTQVMWYIYTRHVVYIDTGFTIIELNIQVEH